MVAVNFCGSLWDMITLSSTSSQFHFAEVLRVFGTSVISCSTFSYFPDEGHTEFLLTLCMELKETGSFADEDHTSFPTKSHDRFQEADGVIRRTRMHPSPSVLESYGAWKAEDGNIFEHFLCCRCQLGAWINAGNFVTSSNSMQTDPSRRNPTLKCSTRTSSLIEHARCFVVLASDACGSICPVMIVGLLAKWSHSVSMHGLRVLQTGTSTMVSLTGISLGTRNLSREGQSGKVEGGRDHHTMSCPLHPNVKRSKSGLSQNQNSIMPEDYVVFPSLILRMRNSSLL